MNKTALIIGASGLVGDKLLQLLLNSSEYTHVLALVRRPLAIHHTKLEQQIIDFEQLSDYKDLIKGDTLFCCLGSTRKKTPDLTLYRKIDYGYTIGVAQIALNNGTTACHLISSMGANAQSNNFYTRLKGEVEKDLEKIGFHSLHIYRPSFIDGDRQELRSLERFLLSLMRGLNKLLIGRLKPYRSITATKIASAMLKQSEKELAGTYIYPSDKIEELA